MANQVAIAVLAKPGSQLICHRGAHVYNFEGGGIAANAGVQVAPVDGPAGTFSGEAVGALLTPADPHFAPTSVVVVENTSNSGGGTVWPDESFDGVVAACRQHDLSLHLDGARLFNAAAATNLAVSHWSGPADTVQLCFSKGLGCPFGAVLAGSRAAIELARRVRQRMGGALRQTGVIAAAMAFALDHHVERLAVDHQRLRKIADALADEKSLRLFPAQTNILYFTHRHRTSAEFAASLKAAGVWVSLVGDRLRLCTHLGIGDDDVDAAIRIISDVSRETS
jgi:threonine aldolase